VEAIAISHPHFRATMVEWSRALGGLPIWIHEDDDRWIMRRDSAVRTWSGASMRLPGGLTLVHIGGRFEGSQVLLWPAGVGGKGAMLAGDLPNVCADSRWVTFMRSYPNYIPLSEPEVERVVRHSVRWRSTASTDGRRSVSCEARPSTVWSARP
jgi:hypothetical protein